MSVWIGKDAQQKIRAVENTQPAANHLGLTWSEVSSYDNPNKIHLLRQLAVKSVGRKEIPAINYKTELKSGVRLIPEYTFTKDGLIDHVIYYYEINSTKKPVIKVTETYQYQAADATLNPSEKGIESREKKWHYYFEDGTLDTDTNASKTKYKAYNSNRLIIEVGNKRRTNIVSILSEKLGAILVVLGVFTTDANGSAKHKAYDALRNVSREFSTDFNEFKLYATKNIYTAITNNTSFTWFNTHVPTQAEFVASGKTTAEGATYQATMNALGLQEAQGKKIKDYMIEKLKGKVL